MTRDTPKIPLDEVIDILKSLVFGSFDRTTAKEREALDIAISALQAQDLQPTCNQLATVAKDTNVPCKDAISRQAAIDAECEVCQIAPKKERGHNCIYYVHGCKEIECLRVLPPAQPEPYRVERETDEKKNI